MAPPKPKAAAATARDFAKRPKAKVGKRAPKKLNSTDTSFKTASVSVRSQSVSLDKNKASGAARQGDGSAASQIELASSRGNALSTLQASLRHHAPAVRASALRGIRDAVQSLSAFDASIGTTVLEANLPSLLPDMCRCWLDEDDDVRDLAVGLFGDLLGNLSGSDGGLGCLVPFVPFLCAYTSSSLNSLDKSVRRDGSAIVGMLASCDPNPSFSTVNRHLEGSGITLDAMAVEVGQHIDSFLPALERSVKSLSFGNRGRDSETRKDSGKKRKRDDNSARPPPPSRQPAKDSTLTSLALILHSSMASDKSTTTGDERRSVRLDPSPFVSGECSFVKGGSACANSLLVFRGSSRSDNATHLLVRSICDLPIVPQDESIRGAVLPGYDIVDVDSQMSKHEDEAQKMEWLKRTTSLLNTLRVKLVELTHSSKHADGGGLLMAPADLETVDLIIHSIRLIHQRCYIFLPVGRLLSLNSNAEQRNRTNKKRSKASKSGFLDLGDCAGEYRTTVQKAISLLLESFPVSSNTGSDSDRYGYDVTNARICTTLAELGSYCETQLGRNWVDAVFSYVLPRLSSQDETKGGDHMATNTLLHVVGKLLIPRSGVYLLENPTKRHQLMTAFGATFFPRLTAPTPELETDGFIFGSSSVESQSRLEELAPSRLGRTACNMLTVLANLSAPRIFATNNDDEETNTLLVLQMVSVLPLYVSSWGERHPQESGQVLATLIAICRQWPRCEQKSLDGTGLSPVERALDALCSGLRHSIIDLFASAKKSAPSIFVRLPSQTQRLAVGLVGLLKRPPKDLVSALSSCALALSSRSRCGVSNYLLEVVHSMRTTVAMPTYLSFLIDSSGVKTISAAALSSRHPGEYLTELDNSVAQLSRFLLSSCDNPTTKVLPMIRPIIHKWLASSSSDDIKRLFQSRAAVSVLAAFALNDMQTSGGAFSLDDELRGLLVSSIIIDIESSRRLKLREDDIPLFLAQLLGPAAVLFVCQQGLFLEFVEAVCKRINDGRCICRRSSDESKALDGDQSVHLRAVLLLLKSRDPISIAEVVRSDKDLQVRLLARLEEIDKSEGGPFYEKCLHQIKLIV